MCACETVILCFSYEMGLISYRTLLSLARICRNKGFFQKMHDLFFNDNFYTIFKNKFI